MGPVQTAGARLADSAAVPALAVVAALGVDEALGAHALRRRTDERLARHGASTHDVDEALLVTTA